MAGLNPHTFLSPADQGLPIQETFLNSPSVLANGPWGHNRDSGQELPPGAPGLVPNQTNISVLWLRQQGLWAAGEGPRGEDAGRV